MEVWPSEFDVTEARRLEGPIHRNPLERGQDSLAWLAHPIGVAIVADRRTKVFVLRGYVVVAEDRKGTCGYGEAVEQRLTGERQRLPEEIRATAAEVVCGGSYSNVVKAVVVQRVACCHVHRSNQVLAALRVSHRSSSEFRA